MNIVLENPLERKQGGTVKTLCIISVFCLFASVLYAQTSEKVTWDYPVRYGTPEWDGLRSYEEQLLAYNIPAEIIKKIATSELVRICLAYPEWGVIDAFSDRRIGLYNMMSHFNGFHELLARNDAAKELIKVYSSLEPLAIGKDWTLLQKGKHSFQINCIELLLAHGMIIDKLDDLDTQILLDEVVLKYRQKRQLPEVYSLWGLAPTAGLCLNILDKNESSSNNEKIISLKRTFIIEDIKELDSFFESIKR